MNRIAQYVGPVGAGALVAGALLRLFEPDRDRLWAIATCRIEHGLLHSAGGRARRRAIRDAILESLEQLSVIQRTRGGRPLDAQAADKVT